MSDHRVRAVTNHLGHVYSLRTKIDETVLAVPRETVNVVLHPKHYKRLMYLLGSSGTEIQRDFQKKYGDIAAHIFAFTEGDLSDLQVWLGSTITLGTYIIVRHGGRKSPYRVYASSGAHTFINSAAKLVKGHEAASVFSARVKVLVDGGLSKRVGE